MVVVGWGMSQMDSEQIKKVAVKRVLRSRAPVAHVCHLDYSEAEIRRISV
jgi:hypothetical protein